MLILILMLLAYADNDFQPLHYYSHSSPPLYQQEQRPVRLHPKQPKPKITQTANSFPVNEIAFMQIWWQVNFDSTKIYFCVKSFLPR